MGFHMSLSLGGSWLARRILCESRSHWLHEERNQQMPTYRTGRGAVPNQEQLRQLSSLLSLKDRKVPGRGCARTHHVTLSITLSVTLSITPRYGLLWNSFISSGEFYPEYSRPQMDVWWDGRGWSGRTMETVAEFEETSS